MASITQLIGMWSDSEEGFDGELREHLVALRVATAHQSDHLVVELEAVWLEFYALGKLSFLRANQKRTHSWT